MPGIEARVARADPEAELSNKLVFRREVLIDMHHLLDRPDTLDDTATLMTDDDLEPAYSQSVNLAESEQVEDLGDGYLRLRFTGILPGRSYRLEIDPGEGPDGETLEPYDSFRGAILPAGEEGPRLRQEIFDLGLDELEPEEGAGEEEPAEEAGDQEFFAKGGMHEMFLPDDEEEEDGGDGAAGVGGTGEANGEGEGEVSES